MAKKTPENGAFPFPTLVFEGTKTLKMGKIPHSMGNLRTLNRKNMLKTGLFLQTNHLWVFQGK